MLGDECRSLIDYAVIHRAMEFYTRIGYDPIEVPWIVPMEAINATMPPEGRAVKVDGPDMNGGLVGSAEQSFLAMMWNGRLSPGRYVAASPCFRPETNRSDVRRNWFFKVELCEYLGVFEDEIAEGSFFDQSDISNQARRFMEGQGLSVKREVIPGQDAVDLVCAKSGLELGSYGMRQYQGYRWVYGTGVAEPRFSIALWGQGR